MIASQDILIVQDSLTQAMQLQHMLRRHGHEAAIARSGAQALAHLEAYRPALILVDALLPDMDGADLCRGIKAQERLKDVPTLLMTESAEASTAGGADGWIAKPYEEASLLARLDDILAGRQERRFHILLAEDSDVNQRLAVRILEKQGHTVVTARNGLEALTALTNEAFDLVLMDVEMPEMGGCEAAATIRAQEQGTPGHIPIIAVTAHNEQSDLDRCLAAGMDAYTSKPLQRDELFPLMERLISKTLPPVP